MKNKNEKRRSEVKVRPDLDKEKISRIIYITAIILSVNHLLLSLEAAVYGLIGNITNKLDTLLKLFLVSEVILLFLFIRIKEKEWKDIVISFLKKYFSKDQVVLMALPLFLYASIVVGTIVEGETAWTSNKTYLFEVIISVFVIYPTGKSLLNRGIPKKLDIFVQILILGLTVYMIYVLGNVFCDNMLYACYGGKVGMTTIDKGSYIEYHLVVTSHHNTTGAYAASFMLLSLLFAMCKKGILRIVYFLATVVHFVALVLTNSRSNFISGGVAVSLLVGICVFYYVKHRFKWNKIIGLIISLLLLVASFSVLCYMRNCIFHIYEYVVDKEINVVVEEETAIEDDIVRDLDPTNMMARDIIWASALQGMVITNRNLIVGVTPSKISDVVFKMSNGVIGTYTHNQILEIGLGMGVPAMCLFILWLVMLANRCLAIGFADEKQRNIKEKMVPIFVFYLVLFNQVEAILFMYNSFINGVFMLCAGWCFANAEKTERE